MTFKAILTVALKEKLNKESLLRGKDDMWRVKEVLLGRMTFIETKKRAENIKRPMKRKNAKRERRRRRRRATFW